MKAKSKRKGNFPPLRFPEFKAEWKRKKLGEVAEITKGKGISKEQLSLKGTLCILYGELYTKYKFEIISEVISRTDINVAGLIKSKSNDVLIPASGETAIDISTTRCIYSNDVLIGGDINILRLKNDNGTFLSYQLNEKRKLDIAKIAQGISVVHLYGKKLRSLYVFFPDLNEQTKIASFLSLIDERIQTQMKIIEEWEKFRYGLRFQLFKQFKNDSVKVKPTKNLINYEQPTKYIVSDNNYSQNPLSTPVLTANKAFILGYTNERFGIYDKGDCIIFDDFTMDMKYVTFPFKVKSSAIKILKPKSNINLRYVFEYLLSLNLKSGEHKRHYISEIASKTIPLLKRGQQNTIASLFLSLDYKIVIEKSLLSTYQEQKKYLLRNLFI